MANIKIPAWDIAEALGLRYVDCNEHTDKWGDTHWMDRFDFHRKVIVVDCEDGSKERVAEDLLLDIGKKLSGMI